MIYVILKILFKLPLIKHPPFQSFPTKHLLFKSSFCIFEFWCGPLHPEGHLEVVVANWQDCFWRTANPLQKASLLHNDLQAISSEIFGHMQRRWKFPFESQQPASKLAFVYFASEICKIVCEPQGDVVRIIWNWSKGLFSK